MSGTQRLADGHYSFTVIVTTTSDTITSEINDTISTTITATTTVTTIIIKLKQLLLLLLLLLLQVLLLLLLLLLSLFYHYWGWSGSSYVDLYPYIDAFIWLSIYSYSHPICSSIYLSRNQFFFYLHVYINL